MMFRNFGIPKSRDALIRRLLKERLSSYPASLSGPFGNFNPREMLSLVDQLDPVSLESMPEAAIAWLVEQILVLCKRGYSLESAIIAIAQFRNEGMGIKVSPPTAQGTTKEIMTTFVQSRINAEFPLPQQMDQKFISWAVEQCAFFFDKRGCTQSPIDGSNIQGGKDYLSPEIENLFEKVMGYLNDDQKLNQAYPPQLQALIMQGENRDILSGAQGEFGKTLENPIPVNGPAGEIVYLSMLRNQNGSPVAFHRLGSIKKIDVYETVSADADSWDILYFSFYHPRKSRMAPSGYKITHDLLQNINGTNKHMANFPREVKTAAMLCSQSLFGTPILPHTDILNALTQTRFNNPSDHFTKKVKAVVEIENDMYEKRTTH
jgi:hypothetical protein